MRWERVLMGVAALVGCGRTGDLTIGPRAGDEVTGGSAGAGGGDTGSAIATTGGSGAGGSAGAECVATCCDGSTVQSVAADSAACETDNGFACAEEGGPSVILFGGDVLWQAAGACPTLSPCLVNCCDGDKHAIGDHFDGALCKAAGQADAGCEERGGTAKIFLGAHTVFQDMTCAGSCQTNCCDGTVAWSGVIQEHECEVWAGRMCRADEGGPSIVAWSGTMMWSAGAGCPSLHPCELVCKDGTYTSTMAYQEKVCLAESIAGAYCQSHGGPSAVSYQGQVVWTAP